LPTRRKFVILTNSFWGEICDLPRERIVQHALMNFSRVACCLVACLLIASGAEAAGMSGTGTRSGAGAFASTTPAGAGKAKVSTGQQYAWRKPATSEPAGERYFVEFRSRTAQSYGHTFVVHGKVTGSKKIYPSQIAGLHPAGHSSATYMLGHVMPVPAETGASYGDTDEQYMTARYRVEMDKAEYLRVAAYIKKLQASLHTWTATQQNCNWFAGEIAQFMGMKVPSPMEMPKDYINQLRAMNTR
jgi:hypothetical protein